MKNELFLEFSRKWNLEYDTVQVIHMFLSFSPQYKKMSNNLGRIGIIIKPRQLKYFYRKVELTERCKGKKFVGSKNYRNIVLRKS